MEKKLIDCLKVGDKVYHIKIGEGIVRNLEKGFICVHFSQYDLHSKDNSHVISECLKHYHEDGTEESNDVNSSLFLNEIKLKQSLPEFVEGEIVLVKRSVNWVVCKYVKAVNDEDFKHCVKIKVYDSIEHVEEEMHYFTNHVKSFDKSHFQQ